MGETQSEIEVDDDLIEKFLTSLGQMAKRNYTKLIEFDFNKDNYIAIVDVDDSKEVEGKRVETKIISREYFDERCDSATEIRKIIYGDEGQDDAKN